MSDDTTIEALQRGLAAEHAAIFAYGVLGPRLTGAQRRAAVDSEAAHRRVRDDAATLVAARGQTPAAAEPGYALPYPVPDAAAARKLALRVEQRVAASWRATLVATSGEARRIATDALITTAVQAITWRRLVEPDSPVTVAFPGEATPE